MVNQNVCGKSAQFELQQHIIYAFYELWLCAWGGTEGMFREPGNYCFPMFMTLFRFHNSPEHGGFECTFLIYQALYHVI